MAKVAVGLTEAGCWARVGGRLVNAHRAAYEAFVDESFPNHSLRGRETTDVAASAESILNDSQVRGEGLEPSQVSPPDP